MGYFVVNADGTEAGPFEQDDLATMAKEGKLLPGHQLRNLQTTQIQDARKIEGLFTSAPVGYTRPSDKALRDEATRDYIKKRYLISMGFNIAAVVFTVVSPLTGLFWAINAVVIAQKTRSQGNPHGNTLIKFALATLVFAVIRCVLLRQSMPAQ